MCGICGQYNFRSSAPADPHVVEGMSRALAHRGPDDSGIYCSGALGLGFRRLSIIDLEGGHQPMSSADGDVWVVFNGEIYNFPELRAELEALGHVFRTRSDTEVIVHGYKQWGQDVLNHLNGMFGLAIWDEPRRRLIVARDAMGMKLVYYRLDRDGLSFGSEVRALLSGGRERPDVDQSALALFLRYRYTPSPYTLYRGVRKLAPGTMLVCEKGGMREVRWYRYKPEPLSPMPSDDEAVEELRLLYDRALRRHLLSDVPVGLLLSGGVDSGLLLALMNQNGGNWPTYTVGYGSSFADDELQLAAETSRLLGSRHSSVELDQETFGRTLPSIVRVLEEPVAASSVVPMYFVSQRARKDVKVALIGQGPDELFGGYLRHIGIAYSGYWRSLPSWVRTPGAAIIGTLPRNETLKRGMYSLHVGDRLRRYERTLSLVADKTMDELFRDAGISSKTDTAFFDCAGGLKEFMSGMDDLGGFQLLELRSTLPDELLMYSDKLSMAHGLEVRVPFLDREIVEWVQRLDSKFKVRHLSRKWLHRRACQKLLPPELVRRRKRGFAVNVVDGWFREGESRPFEELLLDSSALIYGYLRHDTVSRLLRAHASGRADNHKILFSLVVLEHWLRERPLAPEPVRDRPPTLVHTPL